MALGSLNLRVSKEEFTKRIDIIESKMGNLQDVINRYQDAKRNLDQFVEEGDSTYESWIQRIDTNITNCKKAYASLKESRQSLQTTVDQMEGMSSQLKETISSADTAAKSTIQAVLKVETLL